MTTADAAVMIKLIDMMNHHGIPRDRYAIQTPPTDECVGIIHTNGAWVSYAYDHGQVYGMQRHTSIIEAACRLIEMIADNDGKIDAMIEYLDSVVH